MGDQDEGYALRQQDRDRGRCDEPAEERLRPRAPEESAPEAAVIALRRGAAASHADQQMRIRRVADARY